MKKIPFDIIINQIIPYTYNIQPKSLLEDIKNYHTIKSILHRPERKMRQNAVMIYIFYNYVSGSFLNVPL